MHLNIRDFPRFNDLIFFQEFAWAYITAYVVFLQVSNSFFSRIRVKNVLVFPPSV